MHKEPTQIIATLSPKIGTKEMLSKMLDAGMDVVRLNMSHGTHDEHAQLIAIIRELATERGQRIPVIVDLSGPRQVTDEGHTFDAEQAILTEKDYADIAFGIKHEANYFAQSYVGSAQDVKLLRKIIENHSIHIAIIAKIERKEAVEHFAEILDESDAIMFARGDLGEAIHYEEVPFLQDTMVQQCVDAHKPVIIATEMMTSMLNDDQPTRAEVTDVAHAVVTGADAVMLSNETADGEFPLETVQAMHTIITEAIEHRDRTTLLPL